MSSSLRHTRDSAPHSIPFTRHEGAALIIQNLGAYGVVAALAMIKNDPTLCHTAVVTLLRNSVLRTLEAPRIRTF